MPGLVVSPQGENGIFWPPAWGTGHLENVAFLPTEPKAATYGHSLSGVFGHAEKAKVNSLCRIAGGLKNSEKIREYRNTPHGRYSPQIPES